MHNLLLVYFDNLYIFRVYLGPSSGGTYLLYTSDLPTFEQNVVATFAYDTAIMAIGDSNTESTGKLLLLRYKV